MMKLVPHAPVDAAADQVECVAGFFTMATSRTFLYEKYLSKILFSFDISGAITYLLRDKLYSHFRNARGYSIFLIRSDENVSFRISLRWLIHIFNSVDKTKLSYSIF